MYAQGHTTTTTTKRTVSTELRAWDRESRDDPGDEEVTHVVNNAKRTRIAYCLRSRLGRVRFVVCEFVCNGRSVVLPLLLLLKSHVYNGHIFMKYLNERGAQQMT